jgi:hypothetical protein
LSLERRAEGAAFVLPEDAFRYLHELGPAAFPAPGTVPHAALLLSDIAATEGKLGSGGDGPGAGWRGVPEEDIVRHLARLADSRANGRGGWRRELAEDPELFAEEVGSLLSGLDLVRVRADAAGARSWWFSPATARWSVGPGHKRTQRPEALVLFGDDGSTK